MFTIGDALAFVGVCAVVIIAICRFSVGNGVKEKECLLRSRNICNKLKDVKENINELFNQLNDLNSYLRDHNKS